MAYTIKQLAKFIELGQLGLNQEQSLMVFRPLNANDPRVKFLEKNTNWRYVPNRKDVLQATATLENFYTLVETGLRYTPTPRVQKWLTADLSPENNLSSADLKLKNSVLFDWQRDGAKFLYSRDRALLSLSPGLGKTLASSYAAGLRDFDNVLAVVPASLLFYWKSELEKWSAHLPRQPYPLVWHRKIVPLTEELLPPSQFWAITNPETAIKVQKELVGMKFDCLIVDESIMYKHRESSRSEAMKELAKHFPVVWFLSGAPATKNLDDMWHQFHILKPQGYPSYWRFTRNYCLVDDSEWGSKVVGNQRGAEEKIKRNFADIYFSRTQDDVANIPDWIMEDVDVPMLPAQDNAYDILRSEFYVRLESVDPSQIITVGNHLSLMIRSVQLASNPLLVGGVDAAGKWDALPELMKIYPGPYIIWVNFIPTGEILRDRFSRGDYGKLKVALANGSTKMEDRQKMVDAFQREELDAIILNNQVGKFGFTLTKARTAFFVERMYDDSFYQCLHRNRRIGTVHAPIVVKMRSVTQSGEKTIDHLIDDVLDYRTGMIRKVTAGDLKKVFSK